MDTLRHRKYLFIAVLLLLAVLAWVLFELIRATDLFINPVTPLDLTTTWIAESNATVQASIQAPQEALTRTPPYWGIFGQQTFPHPKGFPCHSPCLACACSI
jgi:hypothetical protein